MNEELQKSLAELIAKSVETAESAKGFLLSELPGVVSQLLAWNFTTSLLLCLFCLLNVSMAVYYLLTMGRTFEFEEDRIKDAGRFVRSALFWLSGTVSFIAVWSNFDWLQIWLAPKVYLIEYASKILN